MSQILNYIVTNWMDVLGTVLGLVYLLLEFRTSIWMWIVGSVMPLIYIVVLYQAGIYADCAMEVYYFLAGIYGFAYWLMGKQRDGKAVEISRTPRSLWPWLAAITLALWALIAFVLLRFTDSRVPMVDALTTALSIVGMWMLSRKYIEQWGIWFVVDAISAGLYIYKGVYGRSLLYAIYTLMALYGWWTWHRKMKLT